MSKKGKPLRIEGWVVQSDRDRAAAIVEYIGSPEHKTQKNPINGEPPAPSDGSRCPGYPKSEWNRFTASLRAAVRAGCVSGSETTSQGDLPKYVWGWHGSEFFQARRRSDGSGVQYKGWWIDPNEASEMPLDPHKRLPVLVRRRRT